MKTNNLLLILFPFLLFACQQPKERTDYPLFSQQLEPEKGEKAVIEGKIENLQVYPHVKEIQLVLPNLSRLGEIHTSPIDSSGIFRFEIYPIVSREFSLTPIQDRMLITPGDSLYIDHDFADIMNTRVSGVGSEVNNQISQFRNIYLGRYHFDYEMPYLAYKGACDNLLEENWEKLSRFQVENKTSELFNQWAEKQVRMDYYQTLLFFPFQHYMRTKAEFTDAEAYYSFIPELEQTIDSSMILSDYFQAMTFLIRLKLDGTDPVPIMPDSIPSAKEDIGKLYVTFDNPFLSQFAVASRLSVETQANRTVSIDEEEEQIHRMITYPFLRASLQEEYNRVKKYKANPRIYSDAVMGYNSLETVGTNVAPEDSANVVKKLIDANPGKVLYVDVWATWCSPCLKQMRHSKKLSDQFAGSPVTFVYLCMGGTHEQWQETIAEYDISGVNIYLSENEWMDIRKRFNISGIPHYLLFNKEGVMVDFGLHLLPSLPETKAAIEQALGG